MSRKEIAAIKESLRRAMRKRIESDLLPYAGQWVARSVLEERLRDDRMKARVRALELLLLYVLATAVSLLMISLVWYLAY